MLKIRNHEGEAYAFYQEVVSSQRSRKSNLDFKRQLADISLSQDVCFNQYDEKFMLNRLSDVEAMLYSDIDKENLKSLYNSRNASIRRLKVELAKHPAFTDRILDTCQYCTINEASTLDHVLGKSEFPEFSVHPKNLFPCCSVCNEKKSSCYADSAGVRLFLNLYLDDLPTTQYLHVSLDGNWLPQFRLERPSDVPDSFYQIIVNHYSRLDLLNRFQRDSVGILSDLEAIIRRFEKDRIPQVLKEMCRDYEPFLGYNHRKVVLYRAISDSQEFIDEFHGGVGAINHKAGS